MKSPLLLSVLMNIITILLIVWMLRKGDLRRYGFAIIIAIIFGVRLVRDYISLYRAHVNSTRLASIDVPGSHDIVVTSANSTYQNKYLGMTVDLPVGWHIADPETEQRRIEGAVKLVNAKVNDTQMRGVEKLNALPMTNLFQVSKYPNGTRHPNASISAHALELSHFPGAQTAKDYLLQTKKELEASKLQVDFPRDIFKEQLGGIDFDVLEIKTTIPGTEGLIRRHATVRKGYVLYFDQVFAEEEDEFFENNIFFNHITFDS